MIITMNGGASPARSSDRRWSAYWISSFSCEGRLSRKMRS